MNLIYLQFRAEIKVWKNVEERNYSIKILKFNRKFSSKAIENFVGFFMGSLKS